MISHARTWRASISAMVITLGTLVALSSCSSDSTTTPLEADSSGGLAILSEPVARGFAAATIASAVASSGDLVFVSLPSGAVPGGTRATILNLASGESRTARVIDGGFDPVALAAAIGDEIRIEVSAAGLLVVMRAVVPARRPPRVVRTDPPKGKRDVPLNSNIVVVFSEPVDPATVNESTVRLSLDGLAVQGTVRMKDGSPVSAEFVPAAPLLPETEYRLEVTQGVRDLAGDPLEEAVSTSFTTMTPVPASPHVAVTATVNLIAVGSSTQMMAVVIDGDPGVQYAVSWSLPAGTTAATIDASTGVLTALARGFVSPTACATASSPGGATQTMCGAGTVGVVSKVAVGSGLAFVRNGTVHMSRFDGSASAPLVPQAARPVWSPDGSRIAFTRPTNNRIDKWQLCVASEDGTNTRCATGAQDGVVAGGPSWSPDGVNVAFSVFTYSWLGISYSGLHLLNTLTMRIETVTTGPLMSVSWSPDGHRIAFTSFGGGPFGRGQLGTMNPDGSGSVIVAQSFGSHSVREVAWSPDGSKLALVLWDEHACPWYCNSAIGVVNLDGTDLRMLAKAHTHEESYVGTPTWSPDGSLIAYTLTRGDECGYEHYPCGSEVVVTGVDGVGNVFLASGGFPAWRR